MNTTTPAAEPQNSLAKSFTAGLQSTVCGSGSDTKGKIQPAETRVSVATAARGRPVHKAISKLSNLRQTSDNSWTACCPAHADINPSLSITEEDDGRILMYCHAGCDVTEVATAMRLIMNDLFPPPPVTKSPSADAVAESLAVAKKAQAKKKKKKPKPPAYKPKFLQTAPDATEDWAIKAERYKKQLTAENLAKLAEQLGVPEAALETLHVGWRKLKDGTGSYTFPEFDADGLVLGISTRAPDGQKSFLLGGHRGLYLPQGWAKSRGPVFIVEGASDTATLTAMELAGIGRFSATGGIDLLADLLADVPDDRQICVMGEFDPKPDGRWPGRDGAEKAAARLAQRLGRPVSWALPPSGAKDVRSWLNAQEGH